MKKWNLLMVSFLLCALSAWADGPFRNHRYDAFSVLSVKSDNIVFIGNSITNMHEWWEAFGDHRVINRGVSGAVSEETIANLEEILSGHPAKAFLMIGTNDLGTNGINNTKHVVDNVRIILDRFEKESPETQVYVQSILPSNNGSRTLELLKATNDAVQAVCVEKGVTYVDLWDKLLGVASGEHSFDHLHLTASGYAIWCKAIEEYVGLKSLYPESVTDKNAGYNNSFGMRASYFGALPVNDNDVLFIGDETVHGGEWHELLNCNRIKNRGSGWGLRQADIACVAKEIPVIFDDKAGTPSQVFIYSGASEVAGSTAVADILTAYKANVTAVLGKAPGTTVYLLPLLMGNVADNVTTRAQEFNAALKAYAEETEKVEFVDCYDVFYPGGTRYEQYFQGGYLSGWGYVKMAQAIAPLIEGATAITDAEATAAIAMFNARKNAVANCTAPYASIGDGVGQYTAENAAEWANAVSNVYEKLKANAPDEDITSAGNAVTAALNALKDKINQPKVSTGTDDYWYSFTSVLRGNRLMSHNGVNEEVTGEAPHQYAKGMWKFVSRPDGTYNIVNRCGGAFLSPSATYNTAVITVSEEPSRGWVLEYANTPGLYIVRSNKVELNQTQASQGYKVFNWSSGQSGQDRGDAGCQFLITEVTDEPLEEPQLLMKLTDIVLSGTAPYRVPDAEAAPVLQSTSKSMTIAIDVTLTRAKTGTGAIAAGVLIGSSNEKAKDFFSVVQREAKGKVAVQYIGTGNNTEGWYSRTSSGDLTQRGKVVVTIDENTSSYNFYMNGTKVSNGTVTPSDAYGLRSLSTVPGAALFLGGLVTSESKNYLPSVGTIHSVRVWNYMLTDEEVANLVYDNPGAAPLIPVVPTRIVDGALADTTAWYTMSIASSGFLLHDNGKETSMSLNRITTTLEDEDLWAFVGNDADGYRIYNKKYGTSKVLASPATVNNGTSYVVMKDADKLGSYVDLWQFAESDKLPGQAGFYMYQKGKPDNAVNNFGGNGKLAFWTGGKDHGSTIVFQFGKTLRTVDMAHGTLSYQSGNGNWKRFWTSSAAVPRLTIDAGGYNNMQERDNNIAAYAGTYSYADYQMSTQDGYNISSYTFKAVKDANSQGNVVIKAGNQTITASENVQTVAVDGLKEQQVSFNLSGGNFGAVLSDFHVEIARATEPVKSSFEVFPCKGSEVPYRIPALAKLSNGELLAVADYRYSRADIGMGNGGRIDIRGRISSDNGETWGDIFTIARAGSVTDGYINTGFGDPALVADRESSKVMMLCCSGNVSFPGGQRDNHQAIARFYSEDNGRTWSTPVDLSESIYSQFDTCKIGTARSMFVGSGRIMQSRYVKAGEYYRLYCSVLFKDNNGTNKNYVLYSDDFGGKWNVLGGVNIAPVPSGADEPKVEELPDGSVLCSSRKTNGRWFNIFHFTDSHKAEGSWGNCMSSDGSNQGVASTSNSCNGEVFILPVKNVATNEPAFLALQSVPFASSRANVGIGWKVLENFSDFNVTENFAKDWDGVKNVTRRSSAYSTMDLLSDNTLGFLYEEDLYSCGGGYTIVYKNYSIEEITDSAYTYAGETMSEDIVTKGFPESVEAMNVYVGPNVGMYTQEAYDAIVKAKDNYLAAPSQTLYEEFNRTVAEVGTVGIRDDIKYRLRNTERQGGTLYLVSGSDRYLTAATLNRNAGSQLFTFSRSSDGEGYQLVCETMGLAVSATGQTETKTALTPWTKEKPADALYRIASQPSGKSAIVCLSPANGTYSALHLAGDNTRIVPWLASGSPASLWYIEPTDIATDIEQIELMDAEEPEKFYDLSGREVKTLKKGVYVTSRRRKVYVK